MQPPRIADLQRQYVDDPDPLNCLDELAMARALLHDFLERYENNVEMLVAWYQSWQRGADDHEQMRPQKLLDIADAGRQVETITRIAERIEKLRRSNAISAPELLNILRQLAHVVEMQVSDPETLERIKDGWSRIPLSLHSATR